MNIRFLETFLWLTRLRNFRETAEKLNTTQPNISSRISSLEDQLRTRLYVRGARQFELTMAGRKLVEYAEQIVALAEEMKTTLAAEGAEDPVLQVGIIELVTMSWLPQFVKLLESAEIPIEINIVTETSGNLTEMVRREELDLAFVWGPAHEPQVQNSFICNYAMDWLGARKYANEGEQFDVVDLTKLPVIPQRKGTSSYMSVTEYFGAFGIRNTGGQQRRVSLSSYSIATAIELVRSGLGVMAMAPLMLREEIAAGDVVVLPVRQKLAPCDLTAIYRGGEHNRAYDMLVQAARTAARGYAETVEPDYFWV
jgi:DNA-binding transcriptional LysR family regulator